MTRRLALRAFLLRCWDGLLRFRQQVADRFNKPLNVPPPGIMLAASMLGTALLVAWLARRQ
jgi:hypothetical protein